MYTILMKDNKDLAVTVHTKIYQREKLIDKIQFLLPTTYEDFDLSKFTVILKYSDQANISHAEILTMDEELYHGKLRYILPVDTNLTVYAGNIDIRLTLQYVDVDNNTQYVLHSGETTITVSPISDYYRFIPDQSLEFVDQIASIFEAKAQALDKISESYARTKLDDITLDQETGAIYGVANGVKVGKGIETEELGDVIAETTDNGLVKVIL